MPFVKDFMSPDPITVLMSMNLSEVEKIFVDNRLTVLPVVDFRDQCMGVLSDFRLVKIFLRRMLMKSQMDVAQLTLASFYDEFEPVVTIDENEPIANAFKLVIQSPNHRIFAVKNGKLSGALSPKDLLPFLADDKRDRSEASFVIHEAQRKIQALVRELTEAKASISSLSKMIDSSPFMMHSANWSGQILLANRTMHFALGYEPGELIGRYINDIYPSQLHTEVHQALERIKIDGFNPLVSSLMVRKDQHTLKVDVASMVRRDERGGAIGTITVARPSESETMMDMLRKAASVT
jgi:PAS domain S-box-containing protein